MDCIYESLIRLDFVKLNWGNSFLSFELCILIFVYDSTKWIWSFRNCRKNWKCFLHCIKAVLSIWIFFRKKNNWKLSTDQPFQMDLFWRFVWNHLINQLKLDIPMTQMIFFTIYNHSICFCAECSVTLWAWYFYLLFNTVSQVGLEVLTFSITITEMSPFSFPFQAIYL